MSPPRARGKSANSTLAFSIDSVEEHRYVAAAVLLLRHEVLAVGNQILDYGESNDCPGDND